MIAETPFVRVPLTRGMFTIIDAVDLDFVNSFRWYARSEGSGSGRFYALRNLNKKTLLLHRVLLQATDGQYVDHINHDTLDNRRSNIRICTAQENAFNRQKQPGCKLSQYKGVQYVPRLHNTNPWKAVINLNGKSTHLGCFPTELEAAQAYNQAALQLHKEFACLNPLN